MTVTIQNTGNNSIEANGVVVNIGTNVIEKAELELFLSHPIVEILDEQGVFVYDKTSKKTGAKELIALIGDAHDLDTIDSLIEGESRATVLEAAEKRIAELTEAK